MPTTTHRQFILPSVRQVSGPGAPSGVTPSGVRDRAKEHALQRARVAASLVRVVYTNEEE